MVPRISRNLVRIATVAAVAGFAVAGAAVVADVAPASGSGIGTRQFIDNPR